MGNVGLFCLFLTTAFVVTTSATSFSSWLRGLSFENRRSPLSERLRRARDDNDVQEDVRRRDIHHDCVAEYACWNGHVSTLINDVFSYDLKSLTRDLPHHCPSIKAASCLSDVCFDHEVGHLMHMAINLSALACARQSELRESAACWEPPFHSSMLLCEQRTQRLVRNRDRFFEVLRPCLEATVQNLQCTPGAQELFLEFVDFVIQYFRPSGSVF